jgi:O-antigen/teichoic acid export membrane protein
VLSVAQLLTQALFPALSQAYGASPEVMRRLASRSVKVFALLALPMAAGLAILAPQILALMFTEEFGVATGTLRILAATVWIGFLQVLMGWLITAADRLRSLIGVNVLGLVSGVGLNLLLIPRYGAAGAAISQAVVSIVSLTVLATVAHRARIVTLSGSRLPRILLATAAMGLVTWVAREFNTFLVVGFAAAFYFALIWGMRVVDATELEDLRRLNPGLPVDSSR